MHYHYIEDESGDVEDVVPFCCDDCHRQWCHDNDTPYGGWNGCHEGSDGAEFCASCGGYAGGGADCDCQLHNIVVNRASSLEGEKCEHGHWLQLPAHLYVRGDE